MKGNWIMVTVISAMLMITPLAVLAGGFPANGDFKVAGSADPVYIGQITPDKSFSFTVPLFAHQLTEEKITDPKWQLSASYAFAKGEGEEATWELVTQADDAGYNIKTTNEGDYLVGNIKFNGEGRYYWVRVWGQDMKSKKWLWINQLDKYHRKDKKGQPGYEFLIDMETEEVSTVLENYKTRD